MLDLGFVSANACERWQDKTPFLPSFSFHEQHESLPIKATAESIIQVVSTLDVRADPVINTLMLMREGVSNQYYRLRHLTLKTPPPFGIEHFTVLSRTSHTLSFGLIGEFWKMDFGLKPMPDASSFLQYDDGRSAKLVLRFSVIEHPHDGNTLRTETFVYCPSRRTRFIFGSYWLVIRAGSGLVRRRMLSQVRRILN